MFRIDKDNRPNEELSAFLHKRLPIGSDEKILGVYRHHWFVYFKIWALGLLLALITISAATLLTAGQTDQSESYRVVIGGTAVALVVMIGIGSVIPAWLKSQEQMVVTDESLLQILQPTPFASKMSQLSLQHVADVTARKDFLGTVFGFGKVFIETPGEQKNYEFPTVSNPDGVTKVIIEAHENFIAALESGRLPTNIGMKDPHVRGEAPTAAAPQISAEDYQEFLAFQAAKKQYETQQNQQPAPGPGQQQE